jgi:hypothetical protein
VLVTTGLSFGRSGRGSGSDDICGNAGSLGTAASGNGSADGSSFPAVLSGMGMGRGIGRSTSPDGLIIGFADTCGGSKSDDNGGKGPSAKLGGADDATSGAALFAGSDCVEFDAVKEQVSMLHFSAQHSAQDW